MTNPVLDQERMEFLKARNVLGQVPLPAWPRQTKELNLVELEVDWVRFSTLNHRTRAEQRAEIAHRGRPRERALSLELDAAARGDRRDERSDGKNES